MIFGHKLILLFFREYQVISNGVCSNKYIILYLKKKLTILEHALSEIIQFYLKIFLITDESTYIHIFLYKNL